MANGVKRVAVLGVDPGSAGGLGWAVMSQTLDQINPQVTHQAPPQLLESGVIQTSQMDPDDRSELWTKLRRLIDTWLVDIVTPITAVAYERVHRHSGVHAAHLYGGQVAIIQHLCAFHRVPWITVQVGAVKRFLGLRASGKDKRTAGVDAAHALGYTGVTDHNEADAVGIALAGLAQWKRGHNVFGNWKGNSAPDT